MYHRYCLFFFLVHEARWLLYVRFLWFDIACVIIYDDLLFATNDLIYLIRHNCGRLFRFRIRRKPYIQQQ